MRITGKCTECQWTAVTTVRDEESQREKERMQKNHDHIRYYCHSILKFFFD